MMLKVSVGEKKYKLKKYVIMSLINYISIGLIGLILWFYYFLNADFFINITLEGSLGKENT